MYNIGYEYDNGHHQKDMALSDEEKESASSVAEELPKSMNNVKNEHSESVTEDN